jgi:hypothetical protein
VVGRACEGADRFGPRTRALARAPSWRAVVLRAGCGIAVVALGAAHGCASNDVEPCGLIPEAGCPIGRGGTCEDRTCGALYDCVDGNWRLAEVCSGNTGGFGGGGSGAGGCEPSMIDRTGETDGCTPDLQEPDCPAAAAEVCQPCLSGCFDFYLCKAEGWEAVAFCDEDGHVVIEP